MTWKTIAQLGLWSMATFLLVPAGLAIRWVVTNIYHAWRTWRQDRIELEALHTLAVARAKQEQLVRLQPDAHGFNGVVYNQESKSYRDLDTGEQWTDRGTVSDANPMRLAGSIKQRLLSALTGTTVVQRIAQEILGEPEKPQIQVSDNTWLELESGDVGGDVEV